MTTEQRKRDALPDKRLQYFRGLLVTKTYKCVQEMLDEIDRLREEAQRTKWNDRASTTDSEVAEEKREGELAQVIRALRDNTTDKITYRVAYEALQNWQKVK